jgi:hypothetical protein
VLLEDTATLAELDDAGVPGTATLSISSAWALRIAPANAKIDRTTATSLRMIFSSTAMTGLEMLFIVVV